MVNVEVIVFILTLTKIFAFVVVVCFSKLKKSNYYLPFICGTIITNTLKTERAKRAVFQMTVSVYLHTSSKFTTPYCFH